MTVARRKVSAVKSKALIIHPDPEAVLTLQKTLYRAALETQSKLSSQQTQFLEIDRPKFETWIHTTFTPTLDKCQNKKEEFDDLRSQLDAIEFYSEATGKTHRASAKVIFHEREKGLDEFNAFMDSVATEYEFSDDENDSDYEDEDEDEEIYSNVEEFIDRLFDSAELNSVKVANDSTGDEHFKAIYRECVRLIHPDSVGDKAFRSDLWSELQSAYANQDFHKLEALKENILSDSLSPPPLLPGQIADLRYLVEKKIRILKRDLVEARTDPAWLFSEKLNNERHLKKLKKNIELELKDDFEILSSAVNEISSVLRQLFPKVAKSKARNSGQNTKTGGKKKRSNKIHPKSKSTNL